MDKNKYIDKFAYVIVKDGLNVQKGQVVLIKSPVEAYLLARAVAKAAYEVGAKKVLIDYNDQEVSKSFYLNASDDTLKEIPEYEVEKAKYLIENGACMLSINSPKIGLMEDVDVNKIKMYNVAYMQKMGFFRSYSMDNKGQWCVVAYPNDAWANKVFPKDECAFDKLFEKIMVASRIKIDDEKLSWENHMKDLEYYKDVLNNYKFKSLYFKNSLGTDLEVKLVDGHIWGGGNEKTQGGITFSPNIPTEEVFTMPHKNGVNGRVVATMPLSYQGNLIEDFYLDFKDGAVISYGAKKCEDVLKSILDTDEGSKRLGEVALISYNSPISNMKTLFYNTLFDENASCHLALGNAYTMNIKDGYVLSKEELSKNGYNSSMIHVDFMFGSSDMTVTGTLENGKKIRIFDKGNFVL